MSQWHQIRKPRASVAGGPLMRDFLFGVDLSVREETHACRSRGRFWGCGGDGPLPGGLRGSISRTMIPKFGAAISAASSTWLSQRSRKGMPHAIIRGNNGRRHGRRRFALLNIPRQQPASQSGWIADRHSGSSAQNVSNGAAEMTRPPRRTLALHGPHQIDADRPEQDLRVVIL
jgi:hypothetical protein